MIYFIFLVIEIFVKVKSTLQLEVCKICSSDFYECWNLNVDYYLKQ